MNKPTASKINFVSLVTQIVTIILLMGFIPEKYTPHILVIVGLILPAIVQTCRTWFTGGNDA